jgi:5-methylthioadenosine/S-adenosylhomocysteine deaminase
MIWLDDSEIAVLKEHDVKIAHCPSSNMKISSGILPYPKLKEAGLTLTIATDGAASNNNLDMLEEMKMAALLQKVSTMDPEMLSAEEAFAMGTINGAKALDLNCGEIKEGAWADMILVDLNHVRLVPNHSLIPNLVYSSHGSAIHTTICDGQVLMHNGVVDDEEEVKAEASRMAQELLDKLQ